MAKLPKDPEPGKEAAPPVPEEVPAPTPGGFGTPSEALMALVQMQGGRPAEAAPPFAEAPRGGPPQFPTVDPQAAFYLVHDVNRWGVSGGRLVPQFCKLSGSAGANAVRRDDGGRVSMSLAVASVVESGRILIPHDVDGPGRSYLIPWQVGWSKDKKTGAINPVHSWHLRFETLYVGSREIMVDLDAYADWCASLIAKGVIPQPAPYIFERLISFYRHRMGIYRVKDPQRAESYGADLAAVVAASKTGGRIPATPAGAVDPGLS